MTADWRLVELLRARRRTRKSNQEQSQVWDGGQRDRQGSVGRKVEGPGGREEDGGQGGRRGSTVREEGREREAGRGSLREEREAWSLSRHEGLGAREQLLSQKEVSWQLLQLPSDSGQSKDFLWLD